MNTEALIPTYLVESRELLEQMETGLLALAGGGALDSDTLHAIFRAAHTIKGGASLFGLEIVVAFTHDVENVLDSMREGRIEPTASLADLLLRCADHIGVLLGVAAEGGSGLDPAVEENGRGLLAALRQHLPAESGAPAGPAAEAAAPVRQEEAQSSWRISLRCGPDVFRNGLDPLSFLRYLATLGTITELRTLPEVMPPVEGVDPETCLLAFEIEISTTADKKTLEDVFEFMQDDCKLEITPACVAPAPAAPVAQAGPTLRVDAERLDQLINLVGELVIAAATTSVIGKKTGVSELQESTATLSTLVQRVRDSALQLRMIKIGGTFGRFRRVVHDLARDLGKDIDLVVRGEDTELDKTVVEKIGDPLLHLVRNAIDHGIEPAGVRAAAGKPARGTITLDAYHDSGSIVIEVGDDGGGLPRDKIFARAVERGLVQPGQTLTDAEVAELIFMPGFSTAEEVTNVSGRGVGMDVVRSNISALRGSVGIRSVPGEGTTMTVRLPLTLAIINGFLVGLAGSVFVVPLEVVEECVAFSAERDQHFTNLRGKVLPFIRLREHFQIDAPPPARENIVVIQHAGQRAGLVVDALLGEFQTVVKPLGGVFRRLECVSGSTILGNGEIALILDVPALVQRACERRRAA